MKSFSIEQPIKHRQFKKEKQMKINISHQQPNIVSHTVVERWQRHLKRSKKTILQLEKLSKRIEIIRILTIILLVAFVALSSEQLPYLGYLTKWGIITVLVGIFIYSLYSYKKITKRKKFLTYFSGYYKDALNRRKRVWKKLHTPESKSHHSSRNHFVMDVFSDLAITGDQASLDKLFNMMHCSNAWKKWVSWLSSPASDRKIKIRQQAVKELMSKWFLLLRFLHVSSQYKTTKTMQKNLTNWLKSDDTYESMFFFFITSIFLVILFWGVTIGVLLQIIPPWGFIVVFVLNGLMTALTLEKTDQLFEKIEGLKPIIESMKNRIEITQKYAFNSDYLQEIQAPLITTKNPAIKSLHSIQRLLLMAELRYSGIIYLLLQITLLWNIHVYTGVAHWHRKHRTFILKSYESLSEFEVLISTACFSLENREFIFPTQDDLSQEIKFEALAHPLLSYEQRITNNLDWSNNKPMLLISGSNMAGKSTFMKAIGLNIMLSRLGAPVCANAALFPMINIKSVINVKDSLADGDSYFMVELKRLVLITESNVSYNEQGQAIFSLCLFDEIMSGTNSHDRTEIFKAIVAVLKKKNTFAVFSTHDMKLTNYAKDDPQFSLYEFSEQYNQVDNEFSMHFDYKLKKGVCHHTNAQILLKILGLDTAETVDSQLPAPKGAGLNREIRDTSSDK
ncbi:MAG: hypothetical protein HAW67_00145 [Endozoicomonadaceae bacterium]|nr:hypothetical protein [Endozoicomonadaceae bacterium]